MALNAAIDQGRGVVQNVQHVYKITRESEKEAKSWKSKLSGVLNEQQIFFSLMVIGLFYFANTMTNHFFGNGRDEDYITKNCSCEFIHRFFYRLWFSICFAIWFVIYSLTFLEEVSKIVYPKLGECLKNFNHCHFKCNICWLYTFNYVFCHFSTCIKRCCTKSNNNESTNNTTLESETNTGNNSRSKNSRRESFTEESEDNNNGGTGDTEKSKTDKVLVIEAKIQQLWFYYYKLYVVGYKKDQDEWPIDIQKVSNNTEQSITNPNDIISSQHPTNRAENEANSGPHIDLDDQNNTENNFTLESQRDINGGTQRGHTDRPQTETLQAPHAEDSQGLQGDNSSGGTETGHSQTGETENCSCSKNVGAICVAI